MPATLRAVIKILLLILWCALLVPIQCVVMLFTKGPGSYYVPQLWHKGITRILGIRVEVDGVPPSKHQTIFVANHLSYGDVFAIGSFLRASFVAKEDIESWPVFGFLCKVQQTAFISRSSGQARKVANSLDEMLNSGKSLILFPEGTSTDGRTVLPFKSSLFSLIWRPTGPLAIQPFTVTLLETDGKPLDDSSSASRDIYAWYGDMDFGPHIMALLKTKGAKVRLTFHPVIIPTPDDDRKTLSKQAWTIVHEGLTGPA